MPHFLLLDIFLLHKHLNISLREKADSKSHFSRSTHGKCGYANLCDFPGQGIGGNLYFKKTTKVSMRKKNSKWVWQ